MQKFNRWVTLFSQTGTEIVDLSNKLFRKPDLVITNQQDIETVNTTFFDDVGYELYVVEDETQAYEMFEQGDLITLHGWLKIIPENVCEEYTILNGHPGLITKYPELKGKNPQEKAFKLGLTTGGSVVHEVTSEVDSGMVLSERETTLTALSLEGVYKALRETSLFTWEQVMREYI